MLPRHVIKLQLCFISLSYQINVNRYLLVYMQKYPLADSCQQAFYVSLLCHTYMTKYKHHIYISSYVVLDSPFKVSVSLQTKSSSNNRRESKTDE